jgi:hypothetical protein
MATISLETLAERIAERETELQQLKREQDARQSKLASLQRRKQELETRLKSVEKEIAQVAVGAGGKPAPAPVKAAKAPRSRRRGKRRGGKTLASFILETVRSAGGEPVPVARLAEELTRHKFPTTSGNLPRLVDTRASELVRKGLLRRTPNRAGFVLAANGAAKVAPARVASPPSKRKKSPAKKGRSRQGISLRQMIVQILARSPQPMAARELGEKVLSRGYKTTSKDFTNVMWVALGKMDEVERAPEGGFRLKKGKG